MRRKPTIRSKVFLNKLMVETAEILDIKTLESHESLTHISSIDPVLMLTFLKLNDSHRTRIISWDIGMFSENFIERCVKRENNAGRVLRTIKFEKTQSYRWGRRWWFLCPIQVQEEVCGERVAKLYRPPFSDLFGCIDCLKLTYLAQLNYYLGKNGKINSKTDQE